MARTKGFLDYVPPEYRRTVEGLTRAQASVLQLILSYMAWKHLELGQPLRRARCFTYDGLLKHARYQDIDLHFLTIDRRVRELREKKLLDSYTIGRKTVFCLKELLAEALLPYTINKYGERR